MNDELTKKRAEKDAAFARFVEHSNKASKHSLQAIAARNDYRLLKAEVDALEFDYLTMPLTP